MNKKIKKLLGTAYAASLFLLFALPALALIPPGGPGVGSLPPGKPITLDVVEYLVFRVSIFLITTSAVLAAMVIVWSGITYMYAGEDTAKITAAQGRLKSGVIGAAIVFGFGVILQTVASVVTLDFFCQVRIPIIGTCIWG